MGADIWTEEIFLKAIRTGKHFGTSRPIMPPMPWEGYDVAQSASKYSIVVTTRIFFST